MKRQNKIFKASIAIVLILAMLAAIGIGAYLTDTEVKKDVYTVGNVQAEIVSSGDMEVTNAGYLLPGTVHTYERAATNTGINDAYVFMSLTFPYELVGVSDADGTQLGERIRQIFIPGSADGNAISSEWKLVDVGSIGQYEITANGQHNGEHDNYSVITGNTITYVYGYIGDNADGSLKALKSGETTANLVDTMKLTNLYNVANISGEVSTKLYAIQSNNVNGGLTDVNGVWAVINKTLCGESQTEFSTLTYSITNTKTSEAVGYAPLKLVDGSGNEFASVANEYGNGQFQNVPAGKYTIETAVGTLTINGEAAIIILTGEDQYIDIGLITEKNTLVQGILFNDYIPNTVTSVEFVAMPQTYGLRDATVPEGAIDVSEAVDGSVMAWVEGDVFYVVAMDGGMIYANPNSMNMFANKFNLTYIGTDNLDTSGAYRCDYMFSGCSNLTNTLDDFDISNMKGLYYAFQNCNWITEYTFPEGTTNVPNGLFSYCHSLTSVTLPEGVEVIEGWAFDGCSSLKSINLPNSLTTICENAFHNSGLTEIYIPANVSYIDFYWGPAFANCSKLTSINVDPANEYYTSIDGVLFTKDMKTLLQYPAGKTDAEYTIPTGVEIIGRQAFYYCQNLKTVVIPEGVTTVSYYAFIDCINLATIEVPSSITTIGENAFTRTKWLEDQKAAGKIIYINGIIIDASAVSGDVVLPEGTTEIPNLLFADSKITSIHIPASVKTIGDRAFAGCTNLTTITFAEGSQLESIGEWVFNGCLNLTSIDIPNSVTSIGRETFYNSGLTEINIPANVTSIAHVFVNCNNLTSITIPNNVQDANGAFIGCTNLTEIIVADDHPTIRVVDGVLYDKWMTKILYYPYVKTDITYVVPYGVQSIPSSIFENNTRLEEIVIPSSVKFFEYACFMNCSNLKTINYCGTQAQWNLLNFNACWNEGVHADFTVNYDYSYDYGDYELPDDITYIPDMFFVDNTDIVSITIPASVKSIGNMAFFGCTNLSTVIFEEGSQIETITPGAFIGTAWLNNQIANGEIVIVNGIIVDASAASGDVVLPEGVISIPDYAFLNNVNITSIRVPASVKTIGTYAFGNCSNLTTVTFAEGSQLKSIGEGAFMNCENIISITLPEGVEIIGYGAFYQCSGLSSINLPNSIITIDVMAFENCTSLTTINIPANVQGTSIANAFRGCTSLTAINVDPANEMFCSIDGVLYTKTMMTLVCYPAAKTGTSYIVPEGVEIIYVQAFAYNPYLEEITLPVSVNTIYDYAFALCENLKTINYCSTQANFNLIQFGYNWSYGVHPEFKIVYDYVAK